MWSGIQGALGSAVPAEAAGAAVAAGALAALRAGCSPDLANAVVAHVSAALRPDG